MKEFVKENVQPGELTIYEVLGELAPANNSGFTVLELPYAISIDHVDHRLVMPFFEGDDYVTRWDESDGGSKLDINLASEIPQVLGDLGRIGTEGLDLEIEKGLVYDAEEAKDYYTNLAALFCRDGLLTQQDVAAIGEILDITQTSSMILNNGDFYPRNFIRRPNGKLLLIDWETWNDHSPFFVIDHPENVAAVMYVHMWGNPEWQTAYRDNLTSDLGLDEQALRKGIMMKALQLANLWHTSFPKDDLVAYQIAMIKKEL